MISREIIRANVEHTPAPRPGLTYTRPGKCNDIVTASAGEPGTYRQKRWIEGEFEYYDDMWGNIWRRMKDGCLGGEVWQPVIEDWDHADRFEMPVYDRAAAADHFRAGFAGDTTGERFRVANLPGWIFAQARYIRRLDNYLMDMVLYPEKLHHLHRQMAVLYETVILAASDAGAEAIFFCEDMGTQSGLLFSPAMWDDYFRDLYTRLFALAHECGMKVFMHSCGCNREIIEPLLRAGVNCFQFDQPTVYDFAELAAQLRQYRAALWAPVDIQKIMPTGDRQLIEAGAQAMFEAFRGSLIFKNYGDLQGIGVKPEWDDWVYDKAATFQY
ncbi:MAG: hypothetical protein IJC73_00700 [Lentisphaeria bacterium]|nr:hypothetical protein [Lentisphaeria bacterium]